MRIEKYIMPLASSILTNRSRVWPVNFFNINKQLQCYFSVKFCCNVVSKKHLVNHTVIGFELDYAGIILSVMLYLEHQAKCWRNTNIFGA